jgi:hypothetical protein
MKHPGVAAPCYLSRVAGRCLSCGSDVDDVIDLVCTIVLAYVADALIAAVYSLLAAVPIARDDPVRLVLPRHDRLLM